MGQDRLSNSRPGHVKLRIFRPEDAKATHRVFFEAVRQGAAAHYTQHEREAWAVSDAVPPGWTERLIDQRTELAEIEGRVVGFMSMTQTGHLDLAYVLPSIMGTGIAARLYVTLEIWARGRGITELTTEASHLAKSFFLKQGWQVVAAQKVKRHGQSIANFKMTKELG